MVMQPQLNKAGFVNQTGDMNSILIEMLKEKQAAEAAEKGESGLSGAVSGGTQGAALGAKFGGPKGAIAGGVIGAGLGAFGIGNGSGASPRQENAGLANALFQMQGVQNQAQEEMEADSDQFENPADLTAPEMEQKLGLFDKFKRGLGFGGL